MQMFIKHLLEMYVMLQCSVWVKLIIYHCLIFLYQNLYGYLYVILKFDDSQFSLVFITFYGARDSSVVGCILIGY